MLRERIFRWKLMGFDIVFIDHPVKNSLNFCHPSKGGECNAAEILPTIFQYYALIIEVINSADFCRTVSGISLCGVCPMLGMMNFSAVPLT